MTVNQLFIKQTRINSSWGIIGFTLLVIILTSYVGTATTLTAVAEPTAQELEIQSLADKVNESGKVRVIVGLDTSFIAEGGLASPQAIRDQQTAINQIQNDIGHALSGTNSTLHANYKFIPYMALSVDEDGLNILIASPQVSSIFEDKPELVTLASSIPVIGADDAWTAGFTGEGQTIAILDTGVDKAHVFFSSDNKVVSEACYSTQEPIAGYLSLCPGGVEESTAIGSGVHCSTSINGCYHGTHVAGIAAGQFATDPNVGVAKDADIIAVQVFSYILSTNSVGSFPSDQIKGLERIYALRNNFNIASVNMSLGGDQYFTYCDAVEGARKAAIDNLRSVGIATIIASGNEYYTNSMGAPACISTAVSVGATDDFDNVASFSNVASFLDLYAPGVNITSSYPGNQLLTIDGTSMATPHVAGAWAVLKEHTPTASVDVILAALKNSGTLVDDNRSGGTVQDIPRINVDLALNELNQPPTAVDDGAATPLNTAVTIDVLSNDTDPEMDTLTIEEVGTADHGTVVESGNAILYTPTGGYSGADFFTYTISDGHNHEDTATVTVIVDGESVFLPVVLKN